MNRHHHMSWMRYAVKAWDIFTKEIPVGSIIEINAREHDVDGCNYEYISTIFVKIKSVVKPKPSFFGKIDKTALQVVVETLDGKTMNLLEYGKWGGGASKAEYGFSLSQEICDELDRKRYSQALKSRLFLEVSFPDDLMALKARIAYIMKKRGVKMDEI